MDHTFQKYLFRPYIMPDHVRLNGIQGPSNILIPGVGLSTHFNSVMLRLPNPPTYTQQKFTPEKSESTLDVETQIVTKNDNNSEQTGFGFKRANESEDESDDDIAKTNSKIVSDEVLKAFETPFFRTAVDNFEPLTKKFKSESHKSGKVVKKVQTNRLKFI
jgi:hypothetical protein